MSDKIRKPMYLWAVLTNRCPRCREGKIFVTDNAYDLKNNLKMHEKCQVCGQPTELEVGFYYGTSYVSYGITVLLSIFTFIVWYILIGVSTSDNRFFFCLGFTSLFLFVLQPLLMRLSRSFWISWFVKYDPEWNRYQPEVVS